MTLKKGVKITITALIIIILVLSILIFLYKDNTSVKDNTQTDNYKEIRCLSEQRNVDICIEIYQPVCATINIQCIKAPCNPIKQTFENSCKACTNTLVSTYITGEC